ncbi:endonuclease domain-containing protein [Flavobacterium sp.]|uniref:endonuclease domain-containing protein n=1 Tax=Flavobacterium sp. TaxID=239 RepID=UPI003D1307D9
MRNKIIPYSPHLKQYARELRKNSTLSEVLLWMHIKNNAFGVQFHRQVPMLEYIVDFYCHEIMLAIEIDGNSHEYKYEYDKSRQGELEKLGVIFIRFSDRDVKQNMFSVLISLEKIIEKIVNTPLWSPQGDTPSKEN